MGMVLYEHNQTAYDAAVSMLELTGKAAVIHPTGTGKSFIAFKLCEDNPDKKVCWLSPSEYIFRTQEENWISASCGFSGEKEDLSTDGKTFRKNQDILQENSKGMINPETGSGRMGTEQNFEQEFRNIVFYTYAKLMLMDQDALAEIQPDYIILDEFHRCGAAQWGGGVKRLRAMYPDAKVLGLSATNIRYLDHQRDMAWELFDGNIASELSLGEAVARGILPMPKYVLSIYSYQKELKRYRTRVKQAKNRAVRNQAEKLLEELRRALERADGLDTVFAKHIKPVEAAWETEKDKNNAEQYPNAGFEPEFGTTMKAYGRYLVFCASYDHLIEMKELAAEWFAKVDPAPHLYTAYSDNPDTEREFQAFQEDRSSHLKLLYCIDMFNEGIHIDVDGVILLRPTVSPTIYKQQIGRALASGKRKTPVIFDIVMNIENLYSIGAVEEEIREAVLFYRAGQGENAAVEQFQIIDEIRDCRELFRQLKETLGASWDAMYAMAERYYNEHKNLDVPKRYRTPDGYSLGMWLATQRKVYAGKTAGNLDEIQIKKLSAIGMKWQGTRKLAWEKHYADAVEYYREHGNLLAGFVPYGDAARKERDAALARWLAGLRAERTQMGYDEASRVQKKTGEKIAAGRTTHTTLTAERIAALDAIGMVWDAPDYVWEQHFAAAEKYYREHGSLDLTSYYVDADGLRLGTWIAKQRKLYREQEKTKAKRPYRKAELADRQNRENNGQGLEEQPQRNAIVPKNPTGSLTQKQVERLSAIGMVWETKNNMVWEKSYAAACKYYQEHGDLDVPAGYVTADGCRLGRWVRRQRDVYRETVGRTEKQFQEDQPKTVNSGNRYGYTGNKNHSQAILRVRKLEQIGMVWEYAGAWERRFELAKKYYNEHGNLDMPGDYVVEGVWLARWLREQKSRLEQEDGTAKKVQNPEVANQKQKETKDGNVGTTKVTSIRKNRRALSKVQIEKLGSIGIKKEMLSKSELAWRRQYGEAKEFYLEHGHLSIPKRYTARSGRSLGAWLQHQRVGRRNGGLADWQIMLLDEIGMRWELDDPWQTGYCHAREYYKLYGNLTVPNTYTCEDGYHLGKWISNQRYARRGAAGRKLDAGQITQLDSIGMVWNARAGRRMKC